MQIFNQLHGFLWESMTENNCNTFFIDGPARILIDPGHINHFDRVRKGLEDAGIGIQDIGLVICTHSHPDHLEAAMIFKQSAILMAVHEKEWEVIKAMVDYYKSSTEINLDALMPDFFLNEGEFTYKGLTLKVFHTPGHSPGSVSIYWPDKKALFTGDLIFKDSVGRTDLPGGNTDQLKKSIKKIAALETEYLLPGHGEIISGGKNVQDNFSHIEQFLFPRL